MCVDGSSICNGACMYVFAFHSLIHQIHIAKTDIYNYTHNKIVLFAHLH